MIESEVYMKATGIVRRIDELGRIVIPKEIRKTLRIREGENLEIYIDNEENIVLRKYSVLNKIDDIAQGITDAIHSYLNCNCFITDTDTIIAFSGSLKKEYLNKPIGTYLSNAIQRRECMLENHMKSVSLIENKEENISYAVSTIICNGDAVGMVFLFSADEKLTETDEKITKIVASFLAKHLAE